MNLPPVIVYIALTLLGVFCIGQILFDLFREHRKQIEHKRKIEGINLNEVPEEKQNID